MRSMRSLLVTGAAVGAAAIGGAAIANAAGSSTSSSSSAAASTSQAPPPGPSPSQARPGFNGPAHGTGAHENAEKPVTGSAAAKAQAAAVKAVGGGTAGAVTTDYTQNGYEVTVTKSDGSKVEVHLDSSFNVIQGPAGHAGFGH